jgi:hypothetical protein
LQPERPALSIPFVGPWLAAFADADPMTVLYFFSSDPPASGLAFGARLSSAKGKHR